MKARIANRLQSALWGTIVSLEALVRASGRGTPIQIGLRAGVVILEIILLSMPGSFSRAWLLTEPMKL